MIHLHQVTKTFAAGLATPFTAVDRVSLSVPAHKLTVLKGPSGSGKTTLLSLAGCMVRPTSGRIRLQGLPSGLLPSLPAGADLEVSTLPERFLTAIRRKTFGFIFQQFNLIQGLSALENVMLPAYPTGECLDEISARAAARLEALALGHRIHTAVGRLSGGEAQRVAIARALINDPQVILADEPTAHLDSRLSQEFMELLGQFKSEGRTLLVTSHDPIVTGSALADQILEMRDGQLMEPA